MARNGRRVKKSVLKKKLAADTMLLRGIKQGAGMVNRVPFPRRRQQRRVRARHSRGFNALNPYHLALPRSVGNYTVIRTTTIVNLAKEVVLFGAFAGTSTASRNESWTDIIGCANAGLSTSNINALNNCILIKDNQLPGSGFLSSKLTPAAISVQIMNPNALQTTSGIVFVGRSKQVLALQNDPRTWDAMAQQLVGFSSPRLCSAGKLALRGVQVDAIPYNMSILADFLTLGFNTGGTTTWDNTEATDFEGFGPIFIYNPNQINLQFLVTVEWRVRFDPSNPAYAGHSYHAPTTDSVWASAVKEMEDMGHGVVDIADRVADAGEGVAAVAGIAAMAG